MTLTPKITFSSPMSFILNLDPKTNFVIETISLHVHSMSSTYKHIIAYLPFSNLVYSQLLTLLVEKSSQSKTLSSFSCYCFSIYFSLYIDFKSLHTLFF